MFFEYALDPSLLANWKDFRYFVEKFGWPQGRLISRYPKHWKRMIYDALSGCGEVEKKKIEVRLQQIDDRIVKRANTNYQKNISWIQNAIVEHDRLAFYAIITQINDYNHPKILLGDSLDENEPLWQSLNVPIPQRAENFRSALNLLLVSSKQIKFIDPYFDPQKQRFTNVFDMLLGCSASENRRDKYLQPELHTSIERYYKNENDKIHRTVAEEQRVAQNLIDRCKKKLPGHIPSGLSIMLFIWKEKPGGQQIHNRYILTEKGGVSFGSGLDETDDNHESTDDLGRLSTEQYSLRWKQYSADSPSFELINLPVEIGGTAL